MTGVQTCALPILVDYGFEVVMGCVDLYVFIFKKNFEREFELEEKRKRAK